MRTSSFPSLHAVALALVVAGAASGAPRIAAGADTIACELVFSANDWSPHHQAARGYGTVRCEDGRSLPVRVSMKGVVRPLVGEPRVRSGAGSFAGVADPRDVIGGYSVVRGDTGPNLALRKGGVGLSVTGTGEWWSRGGRPASLVISAR